MDFRSVVQRVAIVLLVVTVTMPGAGMASPDPGGEDLTAPIEPTDVDAVTAVQDDGADNESDDSHWIGPGGSDDNESDNNGSGDENGGEDNESGGGDDDGGIVDSVTDGAGSVADSLNPASSMQSPEETMEDIWEWIADQLRQVMIRLVDDVFNNLMGTPQIENDGALGILGSPVPAEEIQESDYENNYEYIAAQNYSKLYDSVYLPFIMPLIASVISLMALLVLIGPSISAFTKRRMFAALGSAAFCVFLIVASWEFAALLHAFSDGVTQEFLPDGEEVVDSDVTMASGPIALSLLVVIKGASTGILLLAIHGIRHVLLLIMPIVLPALILMAYWGGARKVKQVGSFFIWQYYALLVWNWPTAILLRIAYELEWSFHNSELINIGMTIAIFLMAVVLPLVVSSSFGLIGISMRGAAVGTATAAMGSARSAAPSRPSTSGSARSRLGRLKRGGKQAGISAKNRTQAAYSRSRWGSSSSASSSAPRSSTPNNWNPNEKLGSRSGGSARSRRRTSSVSPGQRRRAANARTSRNTAD